MGTQDEQKQSKNTTQYLLSTNIRKQVPKGQSNKDTLDKLVTWGHKTNIKTKQKHNTIFAEHQYTQTSTEGAIKNGHTR
jgi:hypothetical protein